LCKDGRIYVKEETRWKIGKKGDQLQRRHKWRGKGDKREQNV